MDISGFFAVDGGTKIDRNIEAYKRAVFKLANKGYVTTAQYTYLTDYIKTCGTICNFNWFTEQIESFKPEDLSKRIVGRFVNNMTDQKNISDNSDLLDKQKAITSDETNDILIEFKKCLSLAYSHIFKYKSDENIIRINRNIRYNLSRSDTINFTSEQKTAVHALYDFIIDHKRSVYGLYGYAGTGKTTTVVEFVSYMICNKYLHSVCFAAPTNKALIVIKNKFRSHLKKIIETTCDKKLDGVFNFDDEIDLLSQNGIVINFVTVSKLLMYQTDYSLDGDVVFVRSGKNGSLIPIYEVVLIDECSMIGLDMINTIFEEIRNLRTNNISKTYVLPPKVIFTGDPAQLPPPKEDNSTIFCKNDKDMPFKTFVKIMNYRCDNTIVSDSSNIMKNQYKLMMNDLGKMDTFLLQKVVRSNSTTVTQICTELREWIGKDEFPPLENYMDKPNAYFCNSQDTPNKINSEWFKKFLESVKNGNSSIIITWTNKQTNIYNDKIRRELFKGRNINKFEPSDILMLSEFYGLDAGDEFVKQKLYTSEQIKVISTRSADVPISCFDPILNQSIKRMKNHLKVEGQIKILVDGLNEFFCRGVKFKCWILKVHKFDEDEKNVMNLLVIDNESTEKYTKNKNDSALAIKNFGKQMLNQYRTIPKQIELYIIKPLWKQWSKIFVEPFASVNYGYSITCHKGQGSGFRNVYVDLDDILNNTERPIEAKKCAYTAASRAIDELNFII
jgi:hypothetical protein